MVIFGIDVSHHQGSSLNFVALRKAGVEFCFIKSTESSGFKDSAFKTNLQRARDAGMLVAAYHYVRSGVTAAAQVKNVTEWVPRDIAVIPDVEANSGDIGLARSFVNELRGAGHYVPLLYLPRWYWQQIGSPNLAGLPPLWSSRYPDNVVGSLDDEYSDVPATYWNGYGGLPVAVLQFTSSASVAGHQPLDANAFRGTREELAQLLGYAPPPFIPQPALSGEEDELKIYYVRGDSTAKMPEPHQDFRYGDLVFLVEATADGMKRRHIQYDELRASGASPVTVSHAWLDAIPCPAGLFPWENAGGGPVPGEPE